MSSDSNPFPIVPAALGMGIITGFFLSKALNQHQCKCTYKVIPDAEADTSALPDELLMYIFSFLDVQSIDRAAFVCKRWNVVARDDYLFRVIAKPLGFQFVPNKADPDHPKTARVALRRFVLERDEEGQTVLHKAARTGNIRKVRAALQCGAEILAADNSCRNAVHHTLDFSEDSDLKERRLIIHILADLGCSLDNAVRIDDRFVTPIYIAAEHRLYGMVKYLAAKGADPTWRPARGELNVIELLVTQGRPDVSDEISTRGQLTSTYVSNIFGFLTTAGRQRLALTKEVYEIKDERLQLIRELDQREAQEDSASAAASSSGTG